MEGIIRVTPQELITTAGEFSSKGSVLANLTTEMTNKVASLNSIWEGEAASSYMTKFNGLEDDIQRMLRMVQEHSTDLQEMAANYLQAESQNVEDSGTLSSDVIV